MQKSIGIIGGGVVGLAVKNFYPNSKVYDKYKDFDSLEDVKAQDYIFVCVPTPFNNGFDPSIIDEVFRELSGLKDKVVIIKSTAIPGTSERLQKEYSDLRVFFNPEFLDSSKANKDFSRPDKQILGYTLKSKDMAKEIMSILPRAPYENIMPATAAEVLKYMVNTYYATKVIFANQIYDMCERLGVDYDTVREGFEHDRRVAPGNFDVWYGGFRGFEGKCLPKDLASFIKYGEDMGVDLALLQEVQKINQKLLKNKKPPKK